MSSLVEYDVPSSWIWTKIGNISHVEKEHVEPKETPKTEYNYLSIENVESQTGNLVKFKPTKGRDIGSSKLKFTTDDILYSKLRPYLNKVHIPNFSGISATDLIPIRPEDRIAREYIAYYFRMQRTVEYLNSKVHGIQLPRVSVGDILETSIPLIPLGEQRRVISKIENLSKESKIAREALDKVPEILKKFRQSVLVKAFRGELTSWDHDDDSVDELLERIRQQKRKKWEDDLKSKGKNPDKIKYREPEPIQIDGLPELPSSWRWIGLGEIADVMDVDHKMPKSTSDGIPLISPKDFKNEDVIDFSKAKLISLEDFQRMSKKCKPQNGDILYSRIGTIGKVRLVPSREFGISYSLSVVRRVSDSIDIMYLFYLLQSNIVFQQAMDKRRSIGVPDLGLNDMKKFAIPLAPTKDQKRIVTRINELFSFSKEIEKSIEEAKKRADRMDQAILAKAFRGELVPQDPNDEPASVLLDRIMKEKELEIEPVKKTKNRNLSKL